MIDLEAVYAEIESQLKLADDRLHVGRWGQKPQVPAVLLLLPDSAQRTAYRGVIKLSDVQCLLLVGRSDARQALKDLMRLFTAVATVLDPAFTGSATAIHWASCADVTITEATFDTATVAGNTDAYLAVLFHLDITGAGA